MVKVLSPPSRGAWIEISVRAARPPVPQSRPPRGGRGLKWLILALSPVYWLSPPSRGAWIEIQTGEHRVAAAESPPSRGAWIEIRTVRPSVPGTRVAPLAGGVD